MVDYSKIDQYLQDHLPQSIAELSVFCAQPSISAQNLGLQEAAELAMQMLQKRGFSTKLWPTAGAPIVTAERSGRNPKTILFYNHYDVQPAEPLELWETPPFEPTLRDGKLFARGVSDDKGHLTGRLLALDALLAQDSELPCSVKFILEGEEETSSLHLHDFLSSHTDILQADACVWEFGGVNNEEIPVQSLGLRGICYVELSVETANQDVHSGLGGSIFPNAAWRLVWALNSLKDTDDNILIPGFYDDVVSPTERDIELISKLPETSAEYKQRYGVQNFLHGLTDGVELRVAEVFQPTCTICGLTSGYQGAGSKTVLPAKASAKVDFRLVPNQDPKKIVALLRTHLDLQGFEDVQIALLGSEQPARTDPDHPFVQLVVNTARDVYGVPMIVEPMNGGSGPNYGFVHDLGLPVVSAGIGYPGTQAHAPNENIRLDLYLKGSQHIARIIQEFSQA